MYSPSAPPVSHFVCFSFYRGCTHVQCVFLVSYLSTQFRKTCTWNNAFNPIFYLACILLTFLKKQTVSVAICVLSSSYFSVARLNMRYSIFNSFPNNVNYNLVSASPSISCKSWIWHCVGYNHKTTAKQCYIIYSKTSMVEITFRFILCFVLTKNQAFCQLWDMLRNIFSNLK